MNSLFLYTRYALRSFIRGRSRSIFGAFCVAVGVASVVSLGLVGGNFQDAVTGNAQKLNRGDLSLQLPGSRITQHDYRYFAQLKARGEITGYQPELRVDALLKLPAANQVNNVIGNTIGVDASRFPYYDIITANDPSGVPLKTLLAKYGGRGAVVSQTVFDKLNLRIGGPITSVFRFGGIQAYTVAGIVPDNAPDPGFGGGLFPYFMMIDRATMASYIHANDNAASAVYMTTTTAAQADKVKAEITRHFGGLVSPKTIADVQKDSANGAEGLKKFFRIMSLIAVVIGGIGIINTMLVAARRRISEIAILKALGMKGRQVILAFLIESLFLGVAGTIVGIVLGIGASSLVNGVTQSLAGYSIPWSLHTGPLVAGAIVGIVATLLFSYLPVVRASRVRPIMALRGEGMALYRGGRFRAFRRRPVGIVIDGLKRTPRGILRLPRRKGLRTTLLVLLLAAFIGYLAVLYTGLFSGTDTLIRGAIAGVATLIIAGVLIEIFVTLIWLISKLPSMGRLTLRMAFRSMGTQRRRLGSTLLAFCVGIFAVGSIAILAQNIKSALATGLEKHQNFNVGVQIPHTAAAHARLLSTVAHLPGIQNRDYGAIANLLKLQSVDGSDVSAIIQRDLAKRNSDGSKAFSSDDINQALTSAQGVVGNDVRTSAYDYVVKSGRNLNATDSGTDHVVLSDDFAHTFGIKVGSHVVYSEGKARVPLTVVGVLDQQNFLTFAESFVDIHYFQLMGMTAPAPSHFEAAFLKIDHVYLDKDVATLRASLPGALVLDLSSFLEFTQVIDKLALFPEIIGGLALFAAVIIIANTVALAMLERRREIGVMKAVGARRSTILRFLLVENAIVGFLGAGAGVLLAMLASAILANNLIGISPSFDWTTPIVLVLVGMVLAVAASALTAFPASSEKPMTVLRYE